MPESTSPACSIVARCVPYVKAIPGVLSLFVTSDYVTSTRSTRVGSSAGARIDAPRHRPALRHFVRCGFEQRWSAILEPRHEIFGFKDSRHAVMHSGNKIVRIGDKHRARRQHFTRRLVLPFVP